MPARITLFAAALLTLLVAGGSSAAPESASPRTPPSPGGEDRTLRPIRVGPEDSTGPPRKVRGKVNVVAVPPKSLKLKSAEFGIDGRSIGRATAQPLGIDFDSTKYADGPYTIKAVGRDEADKETWGASVKVEIVNAAKLPEARQRSRPGPGTARRPGSPATPSRRRAGDTRGPGDPKRPSRTEGTPRSGKPSGGAASSLPEGLRLDRTYSSDDYGLSIKFPGTWTFRDETVAMRAKSESDFWIQFGGYPIEKASLVLNVRRVKLDAGTDSERFATYNTYVKSWESKTVLGSPAFATTSRVLGPRLAVIHRLIIIKDGHAWMLNCTDYVGKSPDQSFALLNAMVATIEPAARTQQTGPSGAPQ